MLDNAFMESKTYVLIRNKKGEQNPLIIQFKLSITLVGFSLC